MSSDIVISAEGVGKKYLIGHQDNREVYSTNFRDAVIRSAKSLVRSAVTMVRGQPIIAGDTVEEFWALKNVAFEIKRGEVIGIIGRNGAGKSTLLKVLSRITDPSKGRVEIKGRVASLLEVGTGFHPELTGRENIFLNGAILGMTRNEILRKFDEIVSFAGVEKFLDTPVKRYSSGMYVRLAFAVAAHLEPEILVIDEVLAVGDTQFQRKCLTKMDDVSKEGRTVLFVSHNLTAVSGLCEKALLLHSGELVRSGPTGAVVEDYLRHIQSVSLGVDVRDRKDRSGDGSMLITGLHFGIGTSDNSGYWVTGETSLVVVEYECIEKDFASNIEIAIGIKRTDQTYLFYLGTKVVQQDVQLRGNRGRSVCKIDRLPLEPGRYFLNAEVKRNGIISDRVESASSVVVREGDFYGTGMLWPCGGALCDYAWTHAEL